MGTATKTREVEFYSAGVNFKVVRLNQVEVYLQSGGKNIEQRELAYDFAPTGRLKLKPGLHVLPTGPEGEDEDAIDFLRRSPALNIAFWEDGAEPERLLPTERDFVEELIEATSRQDIDAILEMRRQEASTHARTMLVDATATALEVLNAPVPSLEELEQAAQEATAAGAGLSSG